MQCKAEQEKFTKRVKPKTEGDRKRQERKAEERKRELLKRQRRQAFDCWSLHIREGVREC